MKISVIVPVYNGGEQLRRCLEALAGSERVPDEVIVVDDGSTDDSAQSAADFGFRTIRLDSGPNGPAMARNHGVAASSDPDILLFIDADVVVGPQTVARVEEHFHKHADVAAIFGSYDDDPPERNITSLYKNLLHHYTHQNSDRESSTFWAGCGAIRSEAFVAIGGFDAGYRRPAVEDIELGSRLCAAGYRIHLCPEIQVKHLKRWTPQSMVSTDIFCRALPWSRLVVSQGQLPNELNLRMENRFSAMAAVALVLSLFTSLVFPAALLAAMVFAALFVLLNWQLLTFFSAQGGVLFGMAAAVLHLFYYLYSTAALAWVIVEATLSRTRAAVARS
ncbi:MAG: glycosyltransferase [Chromatiales bacterium]|nr:MAG: glycosyltransferase [Chromatiales bacterium]